MLFVAWLVSRRRALVAIPLVLLGNVLYACAIGLLYDGTKGLEEAPRAAVIVWPILAAALVAFPLCVRWSPPGSPGSRADRAVVWSFAAAGATVAAAGALFAGQVTLDARLAWGAFGGGALMACVAGLMIPAVVRKLAMLAAIAAVPSGGAGVPLAEALRRVRQDRVIASLALLVTLAGCAGIALAIAHAPPFVPPKPPAAFSLAPHC
jgi:hypothetical protein